MPRPARLLLACAALATLFASARADSPVPAKVIAVQVHGTVSVDRGQTAAARVVQDNDALAAGDIIETAPSASVVLVLPNGSTVSLREKSRIAITLVLQTPFAAPDLVVYDNLKPEPATSSTTLELKFGELVASVRKLIKGSDFTIKTPVGTAAVKGTEFGVSYDEADDGEANYRLSTATGLVVFTGSDGKAVEAGMRRQVEVRARVGKSGVKLHRVETRQLADDTRVKIQGQNEKAKQHVNQALMRAKAIDNKPKPPEDRTVKPAAPENTPRDKKPEPPKKPERPAKPGRP